MLLARGRSTSWLIRAPACFSASYSSYEGMVPERRRARAAARAQPHVAPLSKEKPFSTPCKTSTLTKAEIKRASAIFPNADDFSSSESSECSSQDFASEKFSRRRADPQLDTIRRKLIFSQKCPSTSKRKIDMGFGSVTAAFRARKVRGAEQKSSAVQNMGKPEPVFGAAKYERFEVAPGPDVTTPPETKRGRNFRAARVEPESVENLVKQEIEFEVKYERQGKAPRVKRRKTSERTEVKAECDEFAPLAKEESKAKVGSRRRKLDSDGGGGFKGEKSKKRSRKQSGDSDQFALKGSSDFVRAVVTSVAPPASEVNLALDTTSVSLTLSTPYNGPYPSHARPYPEECEAVRDLLSDLHGHLPDYERHKVSCPTIEQSTLQNQGADESGGRGGAGARVRSSPELTALVMVEKVESNVAVPTGHPRERRTILDSLVGTVLSQNTTDRNSRSAFANLKRKYPTWEDVSKADPGEVEETIRCGGLAEIKAARILNILSTLAKERGKICMEYLRSMSNEAIKTELSRFKGVGPKTVACVLMFHLQRKEFPVDTHVFRISKALGWVPAAADREKAYLHLNQRIPDHLKFDLHCLFVTHGKGCPKCSKRQTKKSKDAECPLVNWSTKVMESRSRPSVLLPKASD